MDEEEIEKEIERIETKIKQIMEKIEQIEEIETVIQYDSSNIDINEIFDVTIKLKSDWLENDNR